MSETGDSKPTPNPKFNYIIKVESNDNQIFVTRTLGQFSVTLQNMLEDLKEVDDEEEENLVPVPNVEGKILKKVIDYCDHYGLHSDEPEGDKKIVDEKSDDDEDDDDKKKDKDKEDDESDSDSDDVVEGEDKSDTESDTEINSNALKIDPWDKEFCKVEQEDLFKLILAANFLDIKPLLELGCKTVANMIRGKTPDEIRKTFNIKNDFTPEEEEQIRKENEWCLDL